MSHAPSSFFTVSEDCAQSNEPHLFFIRSNLEPSYELMLEILNVIGEYCDPQNGYLVLVQNMKPTHISSICLYHQFAYATMPNNVIRCVIEPIPLEALLKVDIARAYQVWRENPTDLCAPDTPGTNENKNFTQANLLN